MNFPPYVIDMRIDPPERRAFHLWLPLFLLWPLFLVLGVLALVLTILADVALWAFGQPYHYYTFLLIGLFDLTTELRGTSVYIKSDEALVDFTIR